MNIYVSDVADIYADMRARTKCEPQACAILVAGLLIADEINNLKNGLCDDRALGALDLHTVHIEESINTIASAIDGIADSIDEYQPGE